MGFLVVDIWGMVAIGGVELRTKVFDAFRRPVKEAVLRVRIPVPGNRYFDHLVATDEKGEAVVGVTGNYSVFLQEPVVEHVKEGNVFYIFNPTSIMAEAQPGEGAITVRGLLLETVYGTPLANAPVKVELLSGERKIEEKVLTTDKRGFFEAIFERLGGGVYIVRVSHPGMETGFTTDEGTPLRTLSSSVTLTAAASGAGLLLLPEWLFPPLLFLLLLLLILAAARGRRRAVEEVADRRRRFVKLATPS